MSKWGGERIKHDKNNKVCLRNPSNQAFHLHEFVKLALVLFHREKPKYKDKNKIRIYTEEVFGDNIADVRIIDQKNDTTVWEIQKDDNPTWRKKVELSYLDVGVTPIIIPLKKFKKYEKMINELREDLKEYLL